MRSRRVWAALAAVTMVFSVYSCGKVEEPKLEVENSTANSEEATTEKESSDKTESETDEEDSDETTTTKADDQNDNETTTTNAGEETPETTTAANSGENNSGGDTSGGGDSSDNNNGGGSAEVGASDEEVKEYTAEITLGSSPKVKGNNVTVKGSVVTITAGGDYIFTGKADNAQICVNTGASEDKVTVVLNGVTINNPSAPAIFIEEAKRCTIKPKEGSVNYVSSGVEKSVQDTGAVFSNDTVRLKGNGELNITATASHGINSDDDVIIESGTYNIDSRKSGIITNDDFTINDGSLNVKGGTNGIKSKGTININGGNTTVYGGTKEEKSAVYAAGTFSYTGGSFYAVGNMVSVPTHSEKPYIVADLGKTYQPCGVEVNVSGHRMSLQPHSDFRCVMVLSPDVSIGSRFSVSVDGTESAEFTIENEGCNEFKTLGSKARVDQV